MRRVRRLRTALTVLAVSFIVGSQTALAAEGDPEPTSPTGFADLLPAPDLSGADTKTLFETYSPMAFGLDFESNVRDPVEAVFNGYAHMVMMYIVAITRGAIAVGWWLFSFTDIKPLTDTATSAIGNVNTNLVGWLLPSALAFGAVAAYAQKRSSGSAMGQLVWVLAAGVLATSFAVAPSTWLNGIDGARKFGADTVVNTSTDALGDTVKTPITWPEPSFSGPKEDSLLRKSGDATWRAFAVTPWCVAEFGSLQACERYGKAILDKGTDGDARIKYIDNEISDAEGGDDAATVKWAKGENPFGRVGVLTLGAIVATLFAALTISLAFTALMAFIGCLLLLIIGMFFACMWIIPGRPRQWGMSWLEALIGLVLQSFLAMLIFSVTLTLLTAVVGLTDSAGWLPVSGLAIAVLIAGFRLRRLVEGMATVMRPGAGSLVMGGMARQGATRAVRRMMGALSSRAASPTVTDRTRERSSSSEQPARVSTVRVFRQSPVTGSSSTALPAGRQVKELSRTTDRHSIEQGIGSVGAGAGAGQGRSTGGRGEPSPNGVTRAQSARAQSARPPTLGQRLTEVASSGRSKTQTGQPVVVGTTTSKKAATAGGTSASGSNARGRRLAATPTAPVRYEPRSYSYSASLRDGPPKQQRTRRSGSAPGVRRNFRDYSSVTKDGVTVLVPGRR